MYAVAEKLKLFEQYTLDILSDAIIILFVMFQVAKMTDIKFSLPMKS